MPSVYDLKPGFQALLRPTVQKLAKAGVTANQVTVAAFAMSAAAGGIIAASGFNRWTFLLVPVVLPLRMALNAIDGMLAREHDMKSKLGAVLNELGDVLSDSFLYLPFMFMAHAWPVLGPLVLLLAVISEMTGVVAVQIGASRRYDGPMGKSDRAVVFGVLGLLIGVGTGAEKYVHWAFAAMTALLALTIYNRAKSALKEARA